MKSGKVTFGGKNMFAIFFDTENERDSVLNSISGGKSDEQLISERLVEMATENPQTPSRMIHNICRSALMRKMDLGHGERAKFAWDVYASLVRCGQLNVNDETGEVYVLNHQYSESYEPSTKNASLMALI